MQSDNVVEVEQLRFSYGGVQYALDGVTFSIGKGEIFGFLGRNGAGKTTTIKILTTLVKPTSGTAKVLGTDVRHGGKALRSRIGVVMQEESFDFTTVEKSLDIYGVMWGMPRKERAPKIDELISFFELEDVRKKRMWDLSGGQKRRVQVAREFMHDMDLLFLDEPTVGLDTIARRKILDMVREKAKDGLTVFFTTHNLEEADYLCNRIAIIDRGVLLANDTVGALKRNYTGMKTVEVAFGENGGTVENLLSAIANVRVEKPQSAREPYKLIGPEPEETVRHVIELAGRNGLALEWLNIHPVTLEEVFLKAVGMQKK